MLTVSRKIWKRKYNNKLTWIDWICFLELYLVSNTVPSHLIFYSWKISDIENILVKLNKSHNRVGSASHHITINCKQFKCDGGMISWKNVNIYQFISFFFWEGEGVGFGGMNHIEGPVIIHRRILAVSQ